MINKFLAFSITAIILIMLSSILLFDFNSIHGIDDSIKTINTLKQQNDIDKYTDAEKFKLVLQNIKKIKNLDIVEKDNYVSEININVNSFISEKDTIGIFELIKNVHDSFEIENNITLNITDNKSTKKIFEVK